MQRLSKIRPLRLLMELMLIFLGITSALWFESLLNQRERRGLETEILREMSVALVADAADLRANIGVAEQILASIDTILVHLAERAPYEPALANHFRRAAAMGNIFFHHPAPYEHLKSSGLDVISNSDLRRLILQYYDEEVFALDLTERIFVIGNWEAMTRPQMHQKFEFDFLSTAIPRDYASLLDDVEFQNTLRAAASGLQIQRRSSVSAVTAAEALLADIQVELVGR